MRTRQKFTFGLAMTLGLCLYAEQTTYVLEDFSGGMNKNWYTWGPDRGTIALADSPDGAGKCLKWTFHRAQGKKTPSGLAWRNIKIPSRVTQALGWTLVFSIRGDREAEGSIYVTLNEKDRSCWRTPSSTRVTWPCDSWRRVRIPFAMLTYAWGNTKREGTTFDVKQFASMTFVPPVGSKQTVYIDDVRLSGREDKGGVLGCVLAPDFAQPPLNRFGHELTLPEGTPTPLVPSAPISGPPSRVAIRDDGTTMLNGRPFLPIGVFCVPSECYAEVAAAGFNTLLNYRGVHKQGKAVKQYLDACARCGLMGIVDVQTFTKCARSGRLEPEGLADLVRRSKDHPALLAYYIADEPEYGKVPVEDYVKGYELIKRIDPHHPVIMLNNRFSEMARYAHAADLLMPDPYPGFYQVEGPMRPLSTQGKTVREAMRVKPHRVWFTPQFHNGLCYGNRNRERGDVVGRAPTLHELRFMIYCPLVCGARGIVGWPFEAAGWGVHDAPMYLRGLKAIVSELAALAPFITAQDVKALDVPKPIRALACRYDGRRVVLAVNDSPTKTAATFETQGAATLHVVSERRRLSALDGCVTDDFNPWDVHIYTTKADLAQTALGELLPHYVEAFSMAGTVHPTRNANVALYLHGSRASASSTNRWARANAAINGSYATTWRADKRADEHWIAVEFRRKATIGRVILVVPVGEAGKPLPANSTWTLELKSDGRWQRVGTETSSHFFIHWNPARNRWERSNRPSARPRRAQVYRIAPRTATALRFICKAPRSRPSVCEIEAYAK